MGGSIVALAEGYGGRDFGYGVSPDALLAANG